MNRKNPYHYVYVAYTDNLGYGRIYLGESRTEHGAREIAAAANKGCFIVRRVRRYESFES